MLENQQDNTHLLQPVSQPPTDPRLRVVAVHFVIVVTLFALGGLRYLLEIPADSLVYPACVLLTLLFGWLLWSWKKLTNSLFDPYVLFLVSAMLFNGGQAVLEVFHLNQNGLLNSMFSPDTTLGTLFLVIMGLASLHAGALAAVAKGTPSLPAKAWVQPPAEHDMYLRWVGWAFLLVSFVPALIVLRNALDTVLASGYFALYQREGGTGLESIPQVLSSFLVPGALFLLAGSKGQRTGIAVSGLVICTYTVILLFLGSRASAVMPLLAYVWLWNRRIRPLPVTVIVAAGLVALLVVFPLVGLVRNVSGQARLSLDYLSQSYFSIGNPGIATVSEMGGSMETVAYTLHLVPDTRDFEWGTGYLYALRFVTPNSFWDFQPDYPSASDWLVRTVDPAFAARGGGLGFSFIAEAYLNFGPWGMPLALGVIGFLLAWFVTWGDRPWEPARMAMLASFLSFLPIYARSESMELIRPLIWYSLIPYVAVLAVQWFHSGRKTALSNTYSKRHT